MPLMLPVARPASVSLADVMTSSLEAVCSRANPLGLGAVDRAVIVLVDGLGAQALRSRRGHSRFLAPRLTDRSTIEAGFPTTTAAGLGSLCTGSRPGTHGLVGYRVRDRDGGRIVNQLNGWDDRMVPETWQPGETLFERAAALGVPSFAISQPRFRSSGFTRAVLRGATYVDGRSIEDRFRAARTILDRGGRGLVYLYVPELDKVAHARGWESEAWSALLETIDREIGSFAAGLGRAEGVIVTADHGIVDVPPSRHILYDTVPDLIEQVHLVGGEPRCLQLYLGADATDSDREALAELWRDAEGERAWVATRSEVIASGWLGPAIRAEALPRIGDVLVAARKGVAYYPSVDGPDTERSMVGQHGSLTDAELRVPVIGLGGFDPGVR